MPVVRLHRPAACVQETLQWAGGHASLQRLALPAPSAELPASSAQQLEAALQGVPPNVAVERMRQEDMVLAALDCA